MTHRILYYEEYLRRAKAAGVPSKRVGALWGTFERILRANSYYGDQKYLWRFSVTALCGITPQEYLQQRTVGPDLQRAFTALRENLKKNPETHNPLKDCTLEGLLLFAPNRPIVAKNAWRFLCEKSQGVPALGSLRTVTTEMREVKKKQVSAYEQLLIDWQNHLTS